MSAVATPSRRGTSGRPRSSSAPSTSASTCWAPRSTACATKGGSGTCPGCSCSTANVAARLADWDVAIPAAEEAQRSRTSSADRIWRPAAETAVSLIAGMRGDEEAAERGRGTGRADRGAGRRQHHRRPRPVRQGLWRARGGPARRRLQVRRAPLRPSRPGLPSGDRLVAHRRPGRGRAAHRTGSRRRERASRRSRRRRATTRQSGSRWPAPRPRAACADDAAAQRSDSRRRCARPRPLAVPARPAPARHGQWLRRQRRIAESRAPLRAARDAFDALGCHVVGRPGPPRAARIGRVEPAARPGRPRPADRPGAPDRPARRRGAVQPGDRSAALRLPPHGQHAPLPHLPEARDHRTAASSRPVRTAPATEPRSASEQV